MFFGGGVARMAPNGRLLYVFPQYWKVFPGSFWASMVPFNPSTALDTHSNFGLKVSKQGASRRTW